GRAEDGLVEEAAMAQGAAHDLGADYRRTVVREGDGSPLDKAAHLGQLFALASLGDGPDGKDVGIGGPGRLKVNELSGGLAVQSRLGIGHARNRRDAARQGRRGAGGAGFVLLAARLTQV